MTMRTITPAILLLCGSASAVTLISKSDGLEIPIKESSHTELEIGDINRDGNLDIVCESFGSED